MRQGLRAQWAWLLKIWVVLLVVAPGCGWSQVKARPMAFAGIDATGCPTTVEAALRAMMAQADVVFVGSVTDVRRVAGDGFAAAAGVVEISFQVEQGIRGVDGGSYTLREWGGLWAGGVKRYAVGSRLLMLLHAPGVTGMSSPVGGMDGAIPVKGSSPLVGAEDRTVAENVPVADLRWLQAKLARPVAYAARTNAGATPRAKAMVAGSSAARGGMRVGAGETVADETVVGETVAEMTAREAATLGDSSTPVAQASVATVLQMMASWTKEAGGAR